MKLQWVTLLACVFSFSTFAEISTEEAAAKLREKEAASSKPASITQGEVDRLRAEIVSLKAQLATAKGDAEKAQAAAIAAKLAKPGPAIAQAPATPAVDPMSDGPGLYQYTRPLSSGGQAFVTQGGAVRPPQQALGSEQGTRIRAESREDAIQKLESIGVRVIRSTDNNGNIIVRGLKKIANEGDAAPAAQAVPAAIAGKVYKTKAELFSAIPASCRPASGKNWQPSHATMSLKWLNENAIGSTFDGLLFASDSGQMEIDRPKIGLASSPSTDSGHGEYLGATAYFDPSFSIQLATYQRDDKIHVKGSIRRFTINVSKERCDIAITLEDCTIVPN